MYYMSWTEFYDLVDKLVLYIDRSKYASIYGVPRGGVPLAIALSSRLDLPVSEFKVDNRQLVCDDIIDSGTTRNRFLNHDFVALFSKIPNSFTMNTNRTTYGVAVPTEYIHFPWETDTENGEDIVRRMLQFIGEDANRPGLVDTPKRVVKMWGEIFRAYKEPPPDITVFENGVDGIAYDEMIRDSGYFYSYCEHHMQIFLGQFDFAYVPDKWVMGASKIGRTVNYYSSKLQVAERLVHEIANRIESIVKPKGLMLVMDARHMCKECRGLRMHNSPFGVDVVRGVFRDKELTYKQEFLTWVGNSRRLV